MNLRAAILALTLLASQAWAATGVEAMRANAAGLRSQVSQLRGEQLSKRNELSQVSGRIEVLKSQSKGALLAGSELDQALKRSQELSGTLTDLAQKVSAREVELESANMALLDGLSAELTRLRGEFDRQTDRAARKGLIEQLRRVRAERESVRAALPASKLPSLDTLRPTDDPEELLEQADLLRDNEEKLRRELKTLDARISQRREEIDLDRRVQRFMGEESMFDDQDRRLRLQRKDALAGDAPASMGSSRSNSETNNFTSGPAADSSLGAPMPGPVTAGSAPPMPAPPAFPSLGGFAPNAAGRSPDSFQAGAPPAERSAPGTAAGGLDSRGLSITSSSDARPQVGNGTRSIATGDEDEMDDLDIQRRKVQSLADELKRKAQELEKKASQLR
ncbi:MAG: TetR family transcriptional regulator [Myxococcales bacterium]|nr:TetR family transcriptional regulator [Myxococcales bacterium]MDP3502536.1 TetR family transcriptional regulator [Myxococcales bacterium]